MKFASRSAIESLSSANCGSSASSAKAGATPLLCDPRKDDLEDGRSGVVGRETGDRDRARSGSLLCDAERGCSILSPVSETKNIVAGRTVQHLEERFVHERAYGRMQEC